MRAPDSFWLGVLTFALVGCSFNDGGVGDDTGDDAPDAAPAGDDDGDGVANASDNCVADPNPQQEDEDGDAVGNPCDNCPHVSNAPQADDGEGDVGDGVGDACDPDPDGPGTRLALFEPFDDDGRMADWASTGFGDWEVRDGALHQTDAAASHTIYFTAERFDSAVVETRATADSAPTDGRGIATLLSFTDGPEHGAGYACLMFQNGGVGQLDLLTYRGAQPAQVEATTPLGRDLVMGGVYDLRQSFDGASSTLTCRVMSTSLPQSVSVTATDNTYDGGLIALRTELQSAHFDYVVVYAIGTP